MGPILEILTIGREILDGRVVDTNSVWLAERLREIGIVPRFSQRVDDDFGRVEQAFRVASERSTIVLVTGGLGPTDDDLTAEAFARFLGEPFELSSEALRQVEGAFERMGRIMIEQQRKQAYLPRSCRPLANSVGTAPGLSYSSPDGEKRWYFMPGVPKEMKSIFLQSVLPFLPRVRGYRSSSWATQFTSEGELQARLSSVHDRLPPSFEISYRTRFPENHIGLHGDCASDESRRVYEDLCREISTLLGDSFFSGGIDSDIRNLESVVIEKLIAHRRTIGAVESCTGGLLSSRLTDVSGSSSAVWASWICYDNHAKLALGVDPELLRKHGAVSPEVAKELANAGLRELLKMGASSPICVATTGIAGPGGGTSEKPVGLCYLGLAQEGHETQVMEVRGRAFLERAEYKQLFSQKALDFVRRELGT